MAKRELVRLATPAETLFFTKAQIVDQIVDAWQTQIAPSTVYFLPLSKVRDEDGITHAKLYMESPRTSESWLDGVVLAFESPDDLSVYLELICESSDRDMDSYGSWEANLSQIHNTFKKIDKNRKSSGQKGVRVELCRVSEDGTIESVDDLYDQTTT